MIAVALGMKSRSSKTVRELYSSLREVLGPETGILTDAPLEQIRKFNKRLGQMVTAYRNKKVGYIPGGGGRYGSLVAPWEEDST